MNTSTSDFNLPEGTSRVDTQPPTSAVYPLHITFINIHLTIAPLKSSAGAIALIAVEKIDTLATIDTWHRFTFVDFVLTEVSVEPWYTPTDRNLQIFTIQFHSSH